ncbi:MAG: PfkB family carbohydrate kinase [Pseudolabrys sp.]
MTDLSKNQPTILCAGIAVEDILMRVEHFPAPGTKVSASDYVTVGGGCAANAAVAIARLGGRAAFAGPLGAADDPTSTQIVRNLEQEGIDCSHAVRVNGTTASVSLILIDADGEKTIATRRGDNLGHVLPRDADAALDGIDLLLIDNRFPEFVTVLAQSARARGLPIIIDADKETTEDDPLLSLGTHVIFSTECLRGTTGLNDMETGLRRMRQRLSAFLCATDGAQGAFWFDGDDLRRQPAFAVHAIDTLGAGDTFHGAFALGFAEGQDIPAALRFAAAAAGLKCEHFGGVAGAPRREAVEALLRTRA